MLGKSLALSLVAAATFGGARPPLRVLRTSPGATASPTAAVTIVFDRPVAGSLDYSVDPRAVMHIEPEIAGRLEWRDPITLRLTPSRPLPAGTTYTVTVSTAWHAMDGSQLAEPYRFAFRVRGPALLWGSPAAPDSGAAFVTPKTPFELVYSEVPDPSRVAKATYAEFDAQCGGPAVVRFAAAGAPRPVTEHDPWRYRQRGEGDPPGSDSLRRVVTISPTTPLPRGCRGVLVTPPEASTDAGPSPDAPARWAFRTYGTLRLAEVRCWQDESCPRGPLVAVFSTPVRGAEVLRHVRLFPEAPFTVSDTAGSGTEWTLEARLTPRVAYAVMADTALRDIFGQHLVGNSAVGFRTTGYAAGVEYPFGRLLVERTGFRTLAVQHMNVDTLIAYIAPVADSERARLLAASPWNLGPIWQRIGRGAIERRIAVRHTPDVGFVTTIPLPAGDTSLVAMKVIGVHAPDSTGRSRATELREAPVALLQVTDLAVHAKIGTDNGAVWVTGVSDGRPRPGAQVVLHDRHGQVVASAITGADGVARFNGFRATAGPRAASLVPLQPASDASDDDESDGAADEGPVSFEGYVDVRLGGDRGMIAVGGYEPDLNPWRFALPAASGNTALPVAAAVFTDRGIYRPGERVYAKAIIRSGMLGALRRPAIGDSIQWQLRDREGAAVKDTTVRLSVFGTAAMTFTLPANAGLGDWTVRTRIARYGTWHTVEDVTIRVAEYRPPEFLVDVVADSQPHVSGESLQVAAQARYLFGAPMARAALSWEARQTVLSPYEFQIPGTDGWEIGDGRWWDDAGESDEADEPTTVFASGRDTLDGAGRHAWSVALPKPAKGQGARITVATTVTDVNRQVVVASASTVVHPASFYLAAKVEGSDYFWTTGSPVHIGVVAVRPSGERVRDVAVHGIVVRREWHQVRRVRGGVAELVGDWVTDTVGRCELTTGAEPSACLVTPRAGGEYAVTFRATDGAGREAATSVARWATGPGWVPWDDATQFKMNLVADRASYRVGDTATVLLASPITNANAWLTIEREGIIAQRPLHVTGGSTSIRIPITEAFVPNAFVSVFLTRGRSAPPGKLDDPGRPTIRVGYAALRVLPDVKRLKVAVEPASGEYRPGDTARIAIHVRDAGGVGRAAEVTVWAVDEGVLSLTGYRTPDPIALLYAERGLGVRLSSNLSAVAPQVPEGEKGRRAPGGGGGADAAGVLRSRFQTTAFFVTSVVTDSSGTAVVRAKLPDNLTTFRLMAVAATSGDRYGSGASSLLVTRPLVARPALPRFVRGGDELTAGVVVNQRAGGTPEVRVAVAVQGAVLRGDAEQRTTLEAGRGREVRFPFRVPVRPAGDQDSVSFTFGVRPAEAQTDADRVRVRLPVRPDYTPRAHTIAGVLVDTATVHLVLPEGTDPERSRVSISAGVSPLGMIAATARTLRVYPYDCSEQVTTEAMPILALYRGAPGTVDTALARRQLRSAVDVLSRRQRADGGIGLWDAEDWTTPYLSAYVGGFLAGARSAGIAVNDSVLAGLARYMRGATSNAALSLTPVSDVHESAAGVLSERVAAVSFLRRVGRPDVAAENDLIRQAAQLWPVDRARLAAVIARRPNGMVTARTLLQPEWNMIRVDGRRAVFPDSAAHRWYFSRGVWLPAEVLIATLAVEPQHPLVGPLVEAVMQAGRASDPDWTWTTHDLGALVTALSAFNATQHAAVARGVTVRSGGRIVARLGGARAATADTTAPLTGLLTGGTLTLSLAAGDGPGQGTGDGVGAAALYYYVTVNEVPVRRPVTPDDAGIAVERWYERYDAATPIISAVEGDLVRVRLKVTVRDEREFLVLDDPLPAGLEAVDVSLSTSGLPAGPGVAAAGQDQGDGWSAALRDAGEWWNYGSWDGGWWSPFDHRELRDDRIVYVATRLWPGTYTVSYVARATTPGVFVRPPATAAEMYNPSVQGRTDGGVFTVTAK